MARYKAEFRIFAEVEFDDDGQHVLADQAFDAMEDKLEIHHGFDLELIASSVKEV